VRRRSATVAGRLLLAVAVVVAVAAGCGDDDSGDDATATDPPQQADPSAPGVDPHGSLPEVSVETGDLEIDAPEGFTPVPLVSFGVGLAVPEDWQAIVLTDEAIDQVDDLGVAPGFVDSARNAQRSGAVLYAAGPDATGVADLKLQRIPQPDAPAEGVGSAELSALATAAAGAAPGEVTVSEELDRDPARIRIRFQVSADGVEAEGTQWLVAGGADAWSLVVTSEDRRSHEDLAVAIADTVTFSASASASAT
jgi:hypothetical protein